MKICASTILLFLLNRPIDSYPAGVRSRPSQKSKRSSVRPVPPNQSASCNTLPLQSLPPSSTRLEVSTTANSAAELAVSDKTDFSVKQQSLSRQQQQYKQKVDSSHVGRYLTLSYFCNVAATNFPVVLIPMIANEHFGSSPAQLAAFVAAVASTATLGAGIGKFANGFVCQRFGGRNSSSVYLAGLSALSLALASTTNASIVGYLLAGMEFCASIQWAANALVLANHFESKPALFARGITSLSLASTIGQLAAKLVGTTLLQVSNGDWRLVARFGALTAALGAVVVRKFVTEEPTTTSNNWGMVPSSSSSSKQSSGQSIGQTLRAVLGSPIFWQVGLAHVAAMTARVSDRVLGTFFSEVTSLPRSLCGGLTLSVTFGMIYGLMKTGRSMQEATNVHTKSKMLSRGYMVAVAAALGLALCGNPMIFQPIMQYTSPLVMAGLIAAFSATFASKLAFPFYQIPPTVASTIFEKKHRAVCLSFVDGIGYILVAQLLGAMSKIVGSSGWCAAWTMVASIFAVSGVTMMNVIPKVLSKQQQKKR